MRAGVLTHIHAYTFKTLGSNIFVFVQYFFVLRFVAASRCRPLSLRKPRRRRRRRRLARGGQRIGCSFIYMRRAFRAGDGRPGIDWSVSVERLNNSPLRCAIRRD